ncbi:hypothetical protein ABVK25_005321 [Lepraria finkii]|uniref:Protein SERAC1 n=1 Tax=Lepraria finkii TaxID=1340010 RepID=A0ABR4BAX8_9LECA
MDPVSIFALVSGSASLISQCASAINSFNGVARKYKQAELTKLSMIQEVDTIELAWKPIKEWSEGYTEAGPDVELLERLDRSLKCGTLVISILQDDLSEYDSETLSVRQRSKVSWNERALLDNQHRIRGHVQAMCLLLQVLELPKCEDRSKLLQTSQSVLLKPDESAYSVVPSRISRFSSDRGSFLTVNSAELVYRQLSCDDDLFTARVYKRNCRNRLITSLFKYKNETTAKQSLGLLGDEMGNKNGSANSPAGVDIVAIYGLLGHPLKIWTDTKTRHLWLKDSLQKDIPKLRTLPYIYPSHLLSSDISATMRGFAENLLIYLEHVRGDRNERRIIFVAHRFGGFVGKQALMVAKKESRYKNIYESTISMLFFGNPDSERPDIHGQTYRHLQRLHDSCLESSGAHLLEGRTKSELFAALSPNSIDLENITTSWKSLQSRPGSVSFYEAGISMPLSKKVRPTGIFQACQDADFMPN